MSNETIDPPTTKKWYASKTIYGIAITFIAVIAKMLGFELPEGQTVAGLNMQTVNDIVAMLGLGLAVYGRKVAKAPLN